MPDFCLTLEETVSFLKFSLFFNDFLLVSECVERNGTKSITQGVHLSLNVAVLYR
uniref:Uncharacterized protein n=1 Tax=Anguilla anguilla TaxID=7936 RepID=A0A0E9RXS7_ANGAN